MDVLLNLKFKGTKELFLLRKQLKEFKKQLEAIEDTGSEAYDELVQKIVETDLAIKEANKQQRALNKEIEKTGDSADAYDKLSFQYTKSARKLKNLILEGKEGTEQFEKLQREVNKLDSALKRADAATGKFSRNVGNYPKVLGLAGRKTQKFSKILGEVNPSLGLLGGGFVGIIANLPELIEGINAAADKINEWLTATDTAVQVNKLFLGTLEDTASSYIDQKANIDALVISAQDETLTKEEQLAATQELINISGDYLSEKDKERVLNGEIVLAQKAATAALIDNLAAKARANALEKITQEFQKAQIENLQRQTKATTGLGKVSNTFFKVATAGQLDLVEVSKLQTEQREKELAAQIAGLDEVEKKTREFLKTFQNDLQQSGISAEKTAEQLEKQRAEREEKRKKDAEKAEKDEEKRRAAAVKKAVAAEQRKQDALEKEAARAAEQLKKLQDRTAKETEASLLKNTADLITIQKQQLDAEIQNIEDAEEKQIAILQTAFNRQKAQRQQAEADLEASIKKQSNKIAAAFGEDSEQLVKFRAQAEADLLKIQEANAALEIELERKLQSEITKIKEQEEQKRASKEFQDLKAKQSQIAALLARTEKQIQADRLNKQLTANEEAVKLAKARKDAILEQLAELLKQEQALRNANFQGVQQEKERILNERADLNLKLAQLKQEQTAIEQAESKKQLEAVVSFTEKAKQLFDSAAQIVTGFTQAALTRQNALFDKQIEDRQKAQADLEERLDKATGLEREFLEKKIEREKRAEERIVKDKEEANKKAAKTQKVLAIIAATINGALAVGKALAETTDFTPVQALRFGNAAAAGGLALAQIATIAAQPLATGGVVGKDINGIPIKRSNGDDTLVRVAGKGMATLKKGEVVLNEAQQARAGGAAFFKSIGVPAFASGGVVGGAPLSAPTLQASTTAANKDLEQSLQFIELSKQNTNNINALSKSLQNIQVLYTSKTAEDVERDEKDRSAIKAKAQF